MPVCSAQVAVKNVLRGQMNWIMAFSFFFLLLLEVNNYWFCLDSMLLSLIKPQFSVYAAFYQKQQL